MPRYPSRVARMNRHQQRLTPTRIQNEVQNEERRRAFESITAKMPVLRDTCGVPFVPLNTRSSLLEEAQAGDDNDVNNTSLTHLEEHFQLALQNIDTLFYHESIRIIRSSTNYMSAAPGAASGWKPTSADLEHTWATMLGTDLASQEDKQFLSGPLLSAAPEGMAEEWLLKNLLTLVQGYISERRGYSLLVEGRRAELKSKIKNGVNGNE
ncbi:hypothetical protein VHEMI05530 [[Torrubiella] hemipterigena]|uniref:Uncharacterized protein n=1 Tax=[Torrubiella] hemipterigena TaxID=1531966 RepID=A0A0A1TGY7_9HYPO|nr:hypothetical protein VHEMI05530 [[Torrubiella] hemipterigena]